MKMGKVSLIIITLLIGATLVVTVNNTLAQEPTEIMSIVAEYNNSITVDGNISDWAIMANYSVTLYNFTDASGLPTTTITFAFAYNDTHLFGLAIVDSLSNKQVYGLDWHFFGKPEQDDGVHVDALNWYIYDLAFTNEPNEGPQPDENVGGTNDCFGASAISNTTTIFEFEKTLDSGDSAGKDISLGYGRSIAVEFVSWIGINPSDSFPNYGIAFPDFKYIRLSIGVDEGDELIFGGGEKPPLYWSKNYELLFAKKPDSETINFDGDLSDPAWGYAVSQTVDLQYYEWDTGFWDPSNFITADIYLLFDESNIYIGVSVYNPISGLNASDCFFGVAIGPTVDFYDYSEGFDFIMVNGDGITIDAMMPGNHTKPISDIELGGVDNVVGGGSLSGSYLQIEFKRPLAPSDPNGRDFDYYIGGDIYFGFVASFGHGPPNYVSIVPVNIEGHDEPAVAIYPSVITEKKEGPTITVIRSITIPYVDASNFNLDGSNQEDMYNYAQITTIKLKKVDIDSNIEYNHALEINVLAVYDGQNLFVFFDVSAALADYAPDYWIGLFISPSPEIFYEKMGVDMIMLSAHGYSDMYANFAEDINPTLDTDIGGSQDGDGIVITDSPNNHTYGEFFKPLITSDSDSGRDFKGDEGKYIYLMFMISFGSSDGSPNYFEIDLFPDKPPTFYITEAVFGSQTQPTPTTTAETETNTNTLTIGFSAYDMILIILGLATIPIMFRKIKKKKL